MLVLLLQSNIRNPQALSITLQMSHRCGFETSALNDVGTSFFYLVVYESISRLVLEINQRKQSLGAAGLVQNTPKQQKNAKINPLKQAECSAHTARNELNYYSSSIYFSSS